MAVTKRTRFEVLRRDNHQCRYCGATAPDAPLTVDHVIPVALGGGDDPSNLVTACRDCNAGKSSTSPDEGVVADVQQDALRWSAALKIASERAAARRTKVADYVSGFVDEWDEYGIGEAASIYDRVLPDGWGDSVEGFYRAGLPLADLKHALAVSMSKRHVGRYGKFKYMCGVAWNMLREQQEEARKIVGSEAPDGP